MCAYITNDVISVGLVSLINPLYYLYQWFPLIFILYAHFYIFRDFILFTYFFSAVYA